MKSVEKWFAMIVGSNILKGRNHNGKARQLYVSHPQGRWCRPSLTIVFSQKGYYSGVGFVDFLKIDGSQGTQKAGTQQGRDTNG